MKTTTVLVITAMGISTGASAQSQRLAIPAFYPVEQKQAGQANYDWVRIQQAGSAVKAVVAGDTLVNGAGGTGPGTGCTSSPRAMFDCLHQSGQLVLGYVATGAAQRDLLGGQCACTRADQRCVLHGGDATGVDAQGNPCLYRAATWVDQWYATYCPSAADCHIDGIFFDTGPDLGSQITESSQQTYYKSLYQAVTSRANTDASRGCPNPAGTSGNHPCAMINASQFPNGWVIAPPTSPLTSSQAIADAVILWERALDGADMVSTAPPGGPAGTQRCEAFGMVDTQKYLTRFCPAGTTLNPENCGSVQNPAGWYFDRANTPRVGHVIFSVHNASDITRIISQSTTYGSPALLYIHDEDCDASHGAVYSRLPPYFEQLVSALSPSLDIVIPVTNASTGSTVWVPLSF